MKAVAIYTIFGATVPKLEHGLTSLVPAYLMERNDTEGRMELPHFLSLPKMDTHVPKMNRYCSWQLVRNMENILPAASHNNGLYLFTPTHVCECVGMQPP